MKEYPIVPTPKTKDFKKNDFDFNLSIFRQTKAVTIMNLVKEITENCSYLCVEEARNLLKKMD